jgi:hypothetical protein
MKKYVARLIGETDGYTVSHEFGDLRSAVAWLQGDGLAEFDDQAACGDVCSADGTTI